MLVPRQTQVTIAGNPVLREGDLSGAPIWAARKPPSPGTKPCTTVISTLARIGFDARHGGGPARSPGDAQRHHGRRAAGHDHGRLPGPDHGAGELTADPGRSAPAE